MDDFDEFMADLEKVRDLLDVGNAPGASADSLRKVIAQAVDQLDEIANSVSDDIDDDEGDEDEEGEEYDGEEMPREEHSPVHRA
jgi:hypothetical protein